jgi:hypothetical protein
VVVNTIKITSTLQKLKITYIKIKNKGFMYTRVELICREKFYT